MLFIKVRIHTAPLPLPLKICTDVMELLLHEFFETELNS